MGNVNSWYSSTLFVKCIEPIFVENKCMIQRIPILQLGCMYKLEHAFYTTQMNWLVMSFPAASISLVDMTFPQFGQHVGRCVSMVAKTGPMPQFFICYIKLILVKPLISFCLMNKMLFNDIFRRKYQIQVKSKSKQFFFNVLQSEHLSFSTRVAWSLPQQIL